MRPGSARPSTAPLAQRLRPRTLDELVGQQHVLGEGSALRRAIEERPAPLADPLRAARGRQDDARADRRRDDRRRVRGALGRLGPGRRRARRHAAGARPARRQRPADDPLPRRDPPLQQGAAGRAAARASRTGSITLIGATTENPYFEVNSALLSRCQVVELRAAVRRGARRGRRARGAAALGAEVPTDVVELIARARRRRRAHGAQHLELAWQTAQRRGRRRSRASRRRRRAQAAAPLRQGRRPALRLRLRLHQVDARLRSRRRRLLPRRDARGRRGPALHRPADGDPRLRGRRQRRPAGARSSRSRPRTRSSTSALPEAQLNLAQAAIYLANAPKSKASANAIWSAREECRRAGTCAARRCSATPTTPGAEARPRRRDTSIPTPTRAAPSSTTSRRS